MLIFINQRMLVIWAALAMVLNDDIARSITTDAFKFGLNIFRTKTITLTDSAIANRYPRISSTPQDNTEGTITFDYWTEKEVVASPTSVALQEKKETVSSIFTENRPTETPNDDDVMQLYNSWRADYDKGDFDEARYQVFKENYQAVVAFNANIANDADQLELNEFADLTAEEYAMAISVDAEEPVVGTLLKEEIMTDVMAVVVQDKEVIEADERVEDNPSVEVEMSNEEEGDEKEDTDFLAEIEENTEMTSNEITITTEDIMLKTTEETEVNIETDEEETETDAIAAVVQNEEVTESDELARDDLDVAVNMSVEEEDDEEEGKDFVAETEEVSEMISNEMTIMTMTKDSQDDKTITMATMMMTEENPNESDIAWEDKYIVEIAKKTVDIVQLLARVTILNTFVFFSQKNKTTQQDESVTPRPPRDPPSTS